MTVWFSWLRAAFYAGLLVFGLATAGLMVVFFVSVRDLPRVPDPLSRIIETPPTEIYAATGERLMLIGGRETVPLNRVSPFSSRPSSPPRIIAFGAITASTT